jgi:hypothetical protein
VSAVELGTIEWTRQRPDLWTGRRRGAPVGTIEHGARFTYVDVHGAAYRGYRTLVDAQTAATDPQSASDSGPAFPRWSVHPLLLIAVPAVLIVDAVLLGGATLLLQ